MRKLSLIVGTCALAAAASSFAQAKSDMQCTFEARDVTGEYDGLDFTRAKTACLLDTRPAVAVVPEGVLLRLPQPEVVFSGTRRISSGTWVRVSPNRWLLKRRH